MTFVMSHGAVDPKRQTVSESGLGAIEPVTFTPAESSSTARPPVRRRRVLMVTGIFAPISLVGVVRSLKFCKYIREHGWDAEVLAYRPRPECEDLDERLLAELPADVIVHRTPWIDPTQLVKFARRFRRGASKPALPVAKGEVSANTPAANSNQSVLDRLFRGMPDTIAPWIPFGILGGLRAAMRCDCIYSSAPPFSTHIVASWLHRLSGKPWIADFRDPWVGNEALDPVNAFHQRWHESWESHVVRRSSFSLNVTTELRDRLAARYPAEPAEKFVTIFNGVDEQDLPGDLPRLERSSPQSRLTFSFFGTLYHSRTPVPFFKALRMLLDAGSISADDVRVRIAGHCRMDVPAEIARYGLNGIVELVGRVPHDEALRRMAQTDVLLKIGAPDMDGHSLSTKIFEYLAIGRPILALVPTGPIATLVQKLNAGRVASPGSPDEIASAVLSMLADHRREGLPLNPPCDLACYTRKSQAAQLAVLLNKAVDSPRSGRARRRRSSGRQVHSPNMVGA